VRANCSQRAEPPLTPTLMFDETTRGLSPFIFSAASEL
jgi:predicted transcriptional regulator